MSKSILVIDTPKSCSECILCEPINKDNVCVVLSRIVTDINGVHPQCPLQPVEPLLEALESINYMGVNDGEGDFYNPVQYHKKKEYNKIKSALASSMKD